MIDLAEAIALVEATAAPLPDRKRGFSNCTAILPPIRRKAMSWVLPIRPRSSASGAEPSPVLSAVL